MSTRKKIIIGFIVVFVFGLLSGFTGLATIYMLDTILGEQRSLQEESAAITSVLNAHYIWRQDLTEAVLSGGEFSDSLDHTACAFGQWRNRSTVQNSKDETLLALIAQMEDPHAYIHNEAKNIVTMIQAGNMEEAKRDFVENIAPRTEEVFAGLTAIETHFEGLLNERNGESIAVESRMTVVIIILMAASFLISVLFAWKIISSIMVPIRTLTRAAEAIAGGDVEVEVSHAVNDEIGRLAKSFQNLVESIRTQVSVSESLAEGDLTAQIQLRGEKDVMGFALKKTFANLNGMFGQISASAAQVASGAKQISDGAQALASGSTEQAATVQQFMASLTMVSTKVEENAQAARKALETTAQAGSKMEECMGSMDNLQQAMQAIDESSHNIGKITKVIEDIAFQTNILALNAAVEAARAGQHGKGFAVVAEEVRSLAAKSAAAAQETTALIEGSTARVEEGNRLVNKTGDDMQAASLLSQQTLEAIEHISQSAAEQAEAIGSLSQGMEQISQVVQSNSATAEQSAAAAQEMSSQSAMLDELVSHFKLDDTAGLRQPEALPPASYSAYNGPGFSSAPMGKY